MHEKTPARTEATQNTIGVGAQSILGGKTFLPENICMKHLQNARILRDICPKNEQNA